MGRSPCCDKTGLNKGPWTPAEDLRLITFIHKYGHANWRALPKQAGLLRCGKSCRLRWTNYLRPDIKRGNFTEEEEETIIKLQQTLGNKWSKIASELPGRTDNEIKNVWNTHLKKRLLSRGQAGEEEKSSSPSSSADSSTSSCISQGMKATSPKGPSSALSDEHFLDGSMNGTQVTDIKTGFELNGTQRVLLDKSKGKELSSSSYSTASSPYLPSFSYQEQNDHQQEFNLGEVYDQDSLVKELLKEKDPDEDMLEIPFEVPNMDFLDLLDSTKPTNKSSLCESFEVHQHTADYMEKESESQRWLTYLENELGLEETNDDENQQKIQKNDKENEKQTAIDGSGGSGQIDPVSIYFQMWPSESLLQNF